MSTSSLHRRLGVPARTFDQQTGKESANPFVSAVEDFNRERRREQKAAEAMVAFAQALAGTVMQAPAPEPAGEPQSPAKRRPPRAPEHLGPHAVYTFEEVMRLPRHSPEGCYDPFAVVVPVYPAPDDDEDEQ